MPTDPPPATPAHSTTPPATRAGLWPLLAAGFVTAFGAHAIAATLGRYATGRHASLVELGLLLALYDGAEVVLKPAFGVLADCAKYEAELDKEIRTAKFTLAELEEEEQSLERLRRWHRDLRARDLFGAPSATLAEQRLKHCAERLEDYTDRVFHHLHQA